MKPTPSRTILSLLFALPLLASAAFAAPNEDSLVCAKVKDSYSQSGFTAAFWPRSETYGQMNWCKLEVKAVEHCVPAEAVLQDTNAPYDGFRGPELTVAYTCYKIRCANGEGSSFLGSVVTISDQFGVRIANAPQVGKICLPDR